MFLNFGGRELTDYIKVTNVKRPIIADRVNYSIDIPSVNGEVYTGYKYNTKTIEVEFAVICKDNTEYFNFIRTLGTILDTTIPTKLVIGDEPNIYYYAVIDGATELDKIVSNGMGTLKFLCHNPVGYSNELGVFGAESDGKVTVLNKGSAKTQPKIDVQFTKDANFLQVTNYDGKVILVGSRPSVDKPTVSPSDIVLNEPCEVTTDFVATGNILDSGRVVDGNCTINTGGYGICCANYGSGDAWHGGALRRNINNSLEEFEVTVLLEHDSKGSLKGQGSNATVPPNNGAIYKCIAEVSLWVREGRGTQYKTVTYLKHNDEVTVTDISGGWGKVTTPSGKVGYSSMKYLQYVRDNTRAMSLAVTSSEANTDPSAENRMGRLEVYGFDSNSQKLFKFSIADDNEYFEYTDPDIQIGNRVVLSDGANAPRPNTETKQDSEGKQTITEVDSGKYGKFNEFYGSFKIRRERVNDNYVWSCEINKIVGDKTVERLVSNSMSDGSFPKGNLNHLVIWFGQYKDKPVVDTMAVTDIKVRRLNKIPETPVNKTIFREGDKLLIDCENNKISLNGTPYMTDLDIGSEFFSVGKGVSQFQVISDDRDIEVTTGIVEKWL